MILINKIKETKPQRLIFTCTKNEAFRLGTDWYSKIEMSDEIIRMGEKEFIQEHVLFEHQEVNPIALTPCIHIPSMEFVYIDGTVETDEWATLTATLTAL